MRLTLERQGWYSMAERNNNEKEYIDPMDSMDIEDEADDLDHYFNIDDDERCSLGAAIFFDIFGITVDEIMDEDEDKSIDDIGE